MHPLSLEEQALREGLDYWEVWIARGVRVFLGWEGTSQEQAWEEDSLWQKQAEVRPVKVFINGELAQRRA
jgi:hypothetical protein